MILFGRDAQLASEKVAHGNKSIKAIVGFENDLANRSRKTRRSEGIVRLMMCNTAVTSCYALRFGQVLMLVAQPSFR